MCLQKRRCSGIFNKGVKKLQQCDRYIEENEEYCHSHIFFEELTLEEIDKIKKGEATACNRCSRWYFDNKRKECDPCTLYKKEKHKERKALKPKCKWKDRNLIPCRFCLEENSEYCKFHDYVKDYTEEMKEKSVICTGCNMYKYCGILKSCDVCINRGKENRNNNDHKENKVICKGNLCTFKAQDNGYCGIHQRLGWKEEVEKDGTKKVCHGWKRGCFNILKIEDIFVNCCVCREKERINTDPYTYYKKSAYDRKINFELTNEEIYDIVKKNCFYCNRMNEKNWNGIDRINNDKKIGYIKKNIIPCCSVCNFMKQKINSVEEFVNYCYNIYQNYGTFEFYKIQSDQYIKNKIKKSKYSSKIKNRIFDLTFDDCKEILNKKCFYCKNKNSEKIGIDRFDPRKGYLITNVVPCCDVCNFIKWKFPIHILMDKIINIKEKHKSDDNKLHRIKIELSI